MRSRTIFQNISPFVAGMALLLLGGTSKTSTSANAPKRFALVVGIESYPGGEAALLPGGLLDAQMFRQTLVEGCGFGAGEVEMLLDRKATRAGILGGIERQLQRAARGDLLVLH